MGDRRQSYAHRARSGKMVQRYYSPKRRVAVVRNRVATMYYWSNLSVKDARARLRANTEGATWDVPRDAPTDYLDMLDSERRVLEKGQWRWVQIQNRANHYWDCEAMQVCAAFMLKLIGAESVEAG